MTGDASPVRTALNRAGRSFRPNPSASPLREVLADRRELVTAARERAQSPFSMMRDYAGTSPGKLVLIMMALIIACVTAGWYASHSLEQRTETLRDMMNRTEPLAESAQVLYSSLSVADATANSAFISGGLESPGLRDRYSDALATASSSLITATGTTADTGRGTGSDDRREIDSDLQTLATGIPVYSGLVETARTDNRLGNPVASAYLGEASTMMEDQILPAAQRLYERRSLAISDPQRTLTVPPWGVYIALLLVAVALGATARYLSRRTRRLINGGVLLALVAVVGGTVWLLISGLMSVAATTHARTDAAEPLRALTTARILTQQARSAETLSLARRADQGNLDQTFTGTTDSVRQTLDRLRHDHADSDAVSTARLENDDRIIAPWETRDQEVHKRIIEGNFPEASRMTVGSGPDSTAGSYEDLDHALVKGISTTRSAFRDDINTAQRVLGFTGTGIMTLAVFAALAVLLGLVPRIREYR